MSWLKNLWNRIWGKVKSILFDVIDAIVEEAKKIAKDPDLVNACLNAVKAAAKEGLTGDKAWVYAREILVAELKEAGKQLSDCAIDTALQSTYSSWKAIGYPMD